MRSHVFGVLVEKTDGLPERIAPERIAQLLVDHHLEHRRGVGSSRFPEGIAQLAEWVMTGQLQFREEIVDGLDEVLPTFLRLFDGSNQGKLVIRLPE